MELSKDPQYRLEYAGFPLAEGAARGMPIETASCGKLWRLIAPHLYRQERARTLSETPS